MNKAQLIEKISTTTKTSKLQTERIITAFTDEIVKNVKRGDDVKLVGLGTFTKTKRRTRNGRNPHTGESITIPAGWYPKFRAGKTFSASVR